MLVDPYLSGDKVLLRSLRFQSQDVTRLSVDPGVAVVGKSVVSSADGTALFIIVLGCYGDLMVEYATYKLLSSAAARVPLNCVVLGSRRLEINFCHHFGIGFRIFDSGQAILADNLV